MGLTIIVFKKNRDCFLINNNGKNKMFQSGENRKQSQQMERSMKGFHRLRNAMS